MWNAVYCSIYVPYLIIYKSLLMSTSQSNIEVTLTHTDYQSYGNEKDLEDYDAIF